MSTYHLILREGPGGRLEVRGLPADREERLSVCWRLGDALRVIEAADDPALSAGQGWVKWARQSYINGYLKADEQEAKG